MLVSHTEVEEKSVFEILLCYSLVRLITTYCLCARCGSENVLIISCELLTVVVAGMFRNTKRAVMIHVFMMVITDIKEYNGEELSVDQSIKETPCIRLYQPS